MQFDDAGWTTGETEAELFGAVCARTFGDIAPQAAVRLAGLAVAVRVVSPYDTVVLARITPSAADPDQEPIFALLGSDFVQFLSGEAGDIYTLNRQIVPPLVDGFDEEEAVRGYLSLFLEASRGSAGWRLVEEPDQLSWQWRPSKRRHAAAAQGVSPIAVEVRGRW